MNIIDLPPADLIPYARNPRKNDQAVASVAASIKEFGFKVPIVIDADNVIVCGHTRWKAAQKLGLKSVPCIIADDLSEEQVKAFRLLDNKIGEKAEWDQELLALELGELELDLTPFEIDFSDNVEVAAAEITEVEAPAPPEHPTTEPGDIWILGDHRVKCGDSTDAAVVGQLLDGVHPQLTTTDPPYGVDYVGGTKDPRRPTHRSGPAVTNDNLGLEGTFRLVKEALSIAAKVSVAGASLFMTVPSGQSLPSFIRAMEAAGFTFKHSLVWVKNAFVFGRSDFHYRHELILYGWKEDAAHYFTSDRTLDTVVEADRGDKTIEHPTSKPVAVFAHGIGACAKPKTPIYDPFLGSGTTLVAAEQLGRVCYGMEIAPKYCDVAVERWQIATGKEAVLEATGETYESIRIRKANSV